MPSPAEKLKAAVRDAQIKAMGALKSDPPSGEEQALYEETCAQLAKEWPDHVPLLTQRMQRLSSAKQVKVRPLPVQYAAQCAIVRRWFSRIVVTASHCGHLDDGSAVLLLGRAVRCEPSNALFHCTAYTELDQAVGLLLQEADEAAEDVIKAVVKEECSRLVCPCAPSCMACSMWTGRGCHGLPHL